MCMVSMGAGVMHCRNIMVPDTMSVCSGADADVSQGRRIHAAATGGEMEDADSLLPQKLSQRGCGGQHWR